MPWPFNRRLRGTDRDLAVALIRHLQVQFAMQQLTMETYNDALAKASTMVDGGDEVLSRGSAVVQSGEAVAKYVLPAAKKKLDIIAQMVAEHGGFRMGNPHPKTAAAYRLWSAALRVVQARAELQFQSMIDFCAGAPLPRGQPLDSLDQEEAQALISATAALNNLIQLAGLDADSWLSINCAAFNNVRNRLGLSSLAESDFQAMYFQGLAGGHPRFFA